MLRSRVRMAALPRCAGSAAAVVATLPALQRTRSAVVLPHASRSSLCAGGNNKSGSSSLHTPVRAYTGQVLLSNLAAHGTQVAACTSLSTMLYSPLGTAMLLVLAYNVVIVVSKNVNYVLELTAKDYVQDQQLYVIMRYGILACILLGMEVMFIEV